jgi:type IV pilus assembly protein PilW
MTSSKGFSLIELMVAMTIGLLIALVVSQGYMSAVLTQRSQSDVARLQESARFAFDLFAREARMAGFRDNATVIGATWLQFDPALATSSFIAGSNDAATVSLVGTTTVTPTVLNSSDTITFRFYGSDNTAGTAADGTIIDCQGRPVRRADLLTEVIYVALDSSNNNEPTLFCSSVVNGTGTPAPIPLIPGVESLQILYGEDTDADGVVNRYVPMGSLTSLGNVKSIRVSFVVRTAAKSGSVAAAQSFNHFGTLYSPANVAPAGDTGSVFAAAADGRIRRLFGTVIALRNNL